MTQTPPDPFASNPDPSKPDSADQGTSGWPTAPTPPAYGTPPSYGDTSSTFGGVQDSSFPSEPPYGQAQTPGVPPPPGGSTPGYTTPGYTAPAPEFGSGYGSGGYSQPNTDKTNGLAITSLVTSLLAWLTCGIGAIVGLITGFIALGKTGPGKQKGRGLAIAGIVIGGISLVTVPAILMLNWPAITKAFNEASASASAAAEDDATTKPSQPAIGKDDEEDPEETSDDTSDYGNDIPVAYTLPQDFATGTCFDIYSTEFDLSDAQQVDCGQPHALEIVGTVEWDTPVYGQDDPIIADTGSTCWSDMIDPVLTSEDLWDESDADIYYPSPLQVAAGETVAYCMLRAHESGEMITGSLTEGTYEGVKP